MSLNEESPDFDGMMHLIQQAEQKLLKEPTRPEPDGRNVSSVLDVPVRGGPDALLKVALDALETHVPHYLKDRGYAPITTIREYLDNTKEQEPVACPTCGYRHTILTLTCENQACSREGEPVSYHAPIPPGMVLVSEEPTEDGTDTYVDPDAGKSPAQLRSEGRRHCPKCFTFGYSHRKDCPYKDKGMQHHIAAAKGEK